MAAPTPESATASCPNCGTALHGNFCAECGQPARLRRMSFWVLLKELVEDIWDFDSKAWRSLIPLLFRPGYLTNEYFAGRRARYVPPLRLYLTASVMFFVVAAVTGNSIRVSWGPADSGRESSAADESGRVSIVLDPGDDCQAILLDDNSDWANRWRDRIVTACRKVVADSGRSLQRAAADNVPLMMVVFIPVLALVMKLLYPLSRRFYVEHLIFYLHFHAFGFLMLTLLIVTYESGAAIGWSDAAWRAVAIPSSAWIATYLLIAMRHVYSQGWLATSLKYFLLFVAYIVGLTLSLTGLVTYTALTL